MLKQLSTEYSHITILSYKDKEHFSPDALERIKGIPNVTFIRWKADKSRKANVFARKLRRVIDATHYSRSVFEGYPDLIERFPMPILNKNSRSFEAQLVSNLLSETYQDLFTPEQKIHLLSYVFEQSLVIPSSLRRKLNAIRPTAILISPYLDGDLEPFLFVKYARENSIQSIFAMASWDNLQNKGVAIPKPDKYLVWTSQHAKQLADLHFADSQEIKIVGSEVLQLWNDARISGSELEGTRAPHAKVSVLYCCSSSFISGGKEDDLICNLIQNLNETNQDRILKFTIRSHPQVQLPKVAQMLHKNPSLTDWVNLEITSQTASDSPESIKKLVELTSEHNLCLGINTSVMLESCILGIPIVMLKDGFLGSKFPRTMHSGFLEQYSAHSITSFEELESLLSDLENLVQISGEKTSELISSLGMNSSKSSGYRWAEEVKSACKTRQEISSKIKISPTLSSKKERDKVFKDEPVVQSSSNSFINKAKIQKARKIVKKQGYRSLLYHLQLHAINLRASHGLHNDNSAAEGLKYIDIVDTSDYFSFSSDAFESQLKTVNYLKLNTLDRKIKSVEEYQEHIDHVLYEIRLELGKYDSIVVGPWFSELGFEVLYWIPFLNKLLESNPFPKEKVVIISRSGTEELYGEIQGLHLNSLEYFEKEVWTQLVENAWTKLGGLKQSRLIDIDLTIIKTTVQSKSEIFGHNTLIIHPSVMFQLFRPFWRNKNFEAEAINDFLKFPQLEARDNKEKETVFKIYERPSLEITSPNIEIIENFISTFQGQFCAIIDDSYEDDHKIMNLRFPPETKLFSVSNFNQNLKEQIGIIKESCLLVSTYGGLSYLPLMYGIDSVGLFSDASKFDPQHLKIAEVLGKKNGCTLTLFEIR